jgi:chemotaxis protein MotB
MKKKIALGVVLLSFLAGCATSRPTASQPKKEVTTALRGQVDVVTHKFELAKRENLNLRKELLFFKKYQDIDTQRFISAQEVFEKELADDIKMQDAGVQITDRGLVITVASEKLFVTASDALSDPGKLFLDKIAALVEAAFPRNYLYIEGHTDNQSLAVFEWKSDWDFSFARSLSILKYFTEKKGWDPLRLSASGFGQYRPRASNETKEGRALNRRIVIVISPQKTRITALP